MLAGVVGVLVFIAGVFFIGITGWSNQVRTVATICGGLCGVLSVFTVMGWRFGTGELIGVITWSAAAAIFGSAGAGIAAWNATRI